MEMSLFGQEIQVKEYLPYKEKVEWAKEYVGRAVIIDPSGVIYWGHLAEAIGCLMKLKAYTNMDTSAYETEDGLMELMDATHEGCEAWWSFCDAVFNDWMEIAELADVLYENLEKVHAKSCSLEQKIKESFGFLFTGEDITQSIAHAKDVNEQMIDHLGAIMKAKEIMGAQKQPIDLTQYAKKTQ